MSRPTKLQILRANRDRAKALRAAQEADAAWEEHRAWVVAERAAQFQDTQEWLVATRDITRRIAAAEPPPPAPPAPVQPRRRSLWRFWPWRRYGMV